MGKLILLFSVVGVILYLVADVECQGPPPPFRQFLMMQERAMALRRAFPFGFPGGSIPPGLAARLAAASGPGPFSPTFGLIPPMVAPLSAIGATVVGPRLGLSPLETAVLSQSGFGLPLPLRESVTLDGSTLRPDSLAATLGVDASTLGGTSPPAPTEAFAAGSVPGPSGFGPTPFGGTPSGPGFPTGGFSGTPTGPGGRFPVQTFGGVQRGAGRFAPPPMFRRGFPPRLPRRSVRDPRIRRARMLSRRGMQSRGSRGMRSFPRIPQIPQIPEIPRGGFPGQTPSTDAATAMGTSGSANNVGPRSAQAFPTIPASVGSFNGRTSEFSTENSPNVVFPSQTAQAPVVVSQRRQTPSRFGSSGPRTETQGAQQFPVEPMIPQIPEIPSRSTPSRRAPNGMLQFGNQGLNVRFSRLPPRSQGGRPMQPSFTRRVGMRGIDFARLAGQFVQPAMQPGPLAGPAFETGTGANQNMNIQFQPLPTNQQGDPGRFDPNVVQPGFVAPSGQLGTGIGRIISNSQGNTFTVTKDAAAPGPAEFQIVKVGNLPEFSGTMGSTVDVKMQGGKAVINGQAPSGIDTIVEPIPAETVVAEAERMQPVGDINNANSAFKEVTGSTGTMTDLSSSSTSSSSSGPQDIALDSSSSSSSATDQAATITGTETLKLKSPLEPTDFSFFTETVDIQSASPGQPNEVITLTEAAVIEPPTLKTKIINSESKTPTAVISDSKTLEFPVQGTKANTEGGDNPTKDLLLTAPNNNIQTEISSVVIAETVPGETLTSMSESSSSNELVGKPSTSEVAVNNDLSMFKPPTIMRVPQVPIVSDTASSAVVSQFRPPALQTDSASSAVASQFRPPALQIDTVQADSSPIKAVEGTISSDVSPAV